MRLYEKKHFGVSLLELNKDYFISKLGLFKYLYDGYILAHLMLYPYSEFNAGFKIELSSRKLRYAYVVYLTMLALEFILSKDKKCGSILLNRLQKSGMNSSEIIEFINDIILDTNDILRKIGITKRLTSVSFKYENISMESQFGIERYILAFIDKVDIVSKGYVTRAAFRCEDDAFAMYIIGYVLNSLEFNFSKLPFCIIPCENLADEDMKMDMFSGFDVVVLKNIDKLPSHLFADFYKIWRDFEGKILATYNAYSFIDFNNPELYKAIRSYIIEIPSFFEDKKLYRTMVKRACAELNEFCGFPICKEKDSIFEEIITFDSVFKKIIEKF